MFVYNLFHWFDIIDRLIRIDTSQMSTNRRYQIHRLVVGTAKNQTHVRVRRLLERNVDRKPRRFVEEERLDVSDDPNDCQPVIERFDRVEFDPFAYWILAGPIMVGHPFVDYHHWRRCFAVIFAEFPADGQRYSKGFEIPWANTLIIRGNLLPGGSGRLTFNAEIFRIPVVAGRQRENCCNGLDRWHHCCPLDDLPPKLSPPSRVAVF